MKTHALQAVVFADTDNGGIIHIANIKGGVGKSTVATNLASALSRRGPTLVIDLDVQGSASVALGVDIAQCDTSSWNLFRRRFTVDRRAGNERLSIARYFGSWGGHIEEKYLSWIVGNGEITDCAIKIDAGLELIPANADLFKPVRSCHLANFLYNIQLCRRYYKYIIIDTPSVWNSLTRQLYCHCDLNLIPVTLNALSTRSLRDYLVNVKKLAARHGNVRIRIVKNEVFGRKNSIVKGKTRTMGENRRFLERLCEQNEVRKDNALSLLPQTILFDLEIPESAVVRDAQDEGKTVSQYHHYSSATKAFDELAKRVQYVLNNKSNADDGNFWTNNAHRFSVLSRVAAVIALLSIFGVKRPVEDVITPRPLAPQQLKDTRQRAIAYTFNEGESIYRVAKYAICRFRAVVPGNRDINEYAREVVDVHNRTRRLGETIIDDINRIPKGTEITFYPPSKISNKNEKQLEPVYRYFCGLVKDPFPYVTGDWCERGTGGGTPHYGIDVAASRGSEIRTPRSGMVVLRDLDGAGRTLGVVSDNMIIFFSHLDKRYYRTGDRVEKGAVIGTIGMTGRTSGPHVHIGYGIRSPDPQGLLFGRSRYKLTDPKLFFYREMYMKNG